MAIERTLATIEAKMNAAENEKLDPLQIMERDTLHHVLVVYHRNFKCSLGDPTHLTFKKIHLTIAPEVMKLFDPDVRIQLDCLLRS